MYGLINKAVEGLVRSKFGDATWDKIRTRAGLPDEPFISMEQYDDKTTYDLVGAASAVLGAPGEAILEEFGYYWTKYTAEAGYGELMKSAGKTLPEFLRNLDQMHTRVKLSFPHLDLLNQRRADFLKPLSEVVQVLLNTSHRYNDITFNRN